MSKYNFGEAASFFNQGQNPVIVNPPKQVEPSSPPVEDEGE